MRNRIGSSVLPLRPFFTLFESPLALRGIYAARRGCTKRPTVSNRGMPTASNLLLVNVQRSALPSRGDRVD